LCQAVKFTEQYVVKPFLLSLVIKAVEEVFWLFSLYLSDISSTLSNQFQYADDIALTYQHESTKSKQERIMCIHITQTLDIKFAATQIVYSTAEYCALVWLNSVHTNKIDIQLNNTMRIISGTVKSTQLQWLPVLANIAPPKLRHEATIVREMVNYRRHARSLLYEQMLDIPDQRLLSRRSVDAFFNS
jgi:hypothetical protein